MGRKQSSSASLVLKHGFVRSAAMKDATAHADNELARWARLLTVGLANLPEPPSRVEARRAGGLTLRLYDAQGNVLQLWLTRKGDAAAAYFLGRTTALLYLGEKPLTAQQERWLDEICHATLRTERHSGWMDFLERAAERLAETALGYDPTQRVTSGDSALLRVTSRCQARCDFCSSLGVLHDLVTDLPAVRRRVAIAVREGRQTVSFTGGEPTLRRDLADLVTAARAEGITGVELQTNGILLANRALVAQLAEAGLTCLFLSLHSSSAQEHDAMLHVSGAHRKALRGASHAIDAGIRVVVNHVTTRQNLSGLPKFVELVAARLGPVGIRLSVMAPEGGGASLLEDMPHLGEAASILASAIDVGKELGMDMRIPGLCGIPPCVLPGYEVHFEELLDEVPPPRLITRRHVPACKACPNRARCSGYWTAYLERHGVGELYPRGIQPQIPGEAPGHEP